VLGTSCLGIFGPLLETDWVLARTLLDANRVCIAYNLMRGAIGARASYTRSLFCNVGSKISIICFPSPVLKPLV